MMMTSTASKVDPILAITNHMLNNYAYGDAIILAERCHAEANSPESLHLLSTTYYRSGRLTQCYNILKTILIKQLNYKCKYLLAICQYDMGNLSDSEQTLLSNGTTEFENYNEIESFVCKLYAKILQHTDRTELSLHYYKKSLKTNPFMFGSWEMICGTMSSDQVEDSEEYFKLTADTLPKITGTVAATETDTIFKTPTTTNIKKTIPLTEEFNLNKRNPIKFNRNQLFTSTPMQQTGGQQGQQQGLNSTFDNSPLQQPSGPNQQQSSFSLISFNSSAGSSTSLEQPSAKKPSSASGSSPASAATGSQSVRRSSRLVTSTNSVKENYKTPSQSQPAQQLTQPVSQQLTRRQLQLQSTLITPSPKKKESELDEKIAIAEMSLCEPLLLIIKTIAKAYQHLTTYHCREAIELLTKLKPNQYNTAWIASLLGKCYFEMGDYEECCRYYTLQRQLDPSKLEGLDLYSTALWHLQRDIDLSILSHDLLSLNKAHTSTWIAAGNCFSLNKEYETSIKFFKRSIQIDKNYEYGYTLLGHEYVAVDECEKAMRCFRNATRINPRHYNSWYGMGMIFYKQERFNRAEIYYRKALKIHPRNSVLLCHLGVVQHSLNKIEESLATFTLALKANPIDPLCKFHRASVLFNCNRLDESLQELEELKSIVPRESLVYFLIAKVFSKKGETHKALLHFSWATDLDPKGANNQIKESIEPVLSKSALTDQQQLLDDDDYMAQSAEEIVRGVVGEDLGDDLLE